MCQFIDLALLFFFLESLFIDFDCPFVLTFSRSHRYLHAPCHFLSQFVLTARVAVGTLKHSKSRKWPKCMHNKQRRDAIFG